MVRIRRYLVIGPHAVLGRRTGEDVYLADPRQAERLLRAGHLDPLAAGPPPAPEPTTRPRRSPGPSHATETADRPHKRTEE